MGVGHLDIGLGEGSAQVFGHNPAVAQYAQILAKQQAKRDADNKYLADTLAQAKPEGLRNDADRQSFYKKYADLKNQAISAEGEKDKFKKAMAVANVRQGIMDLNSYVDQSKKQAAKENQFAQAYIQNPTAWSDESIDSHRKSTNLAVDDPNVVKDYTTLARQPDLVKLDTRLKKVRDDLLDGVKGEDMVTSRKKVGNKWVNTVQTKYTADPEDVNHAFLNEFDINRDFQHQLVSQYGQAVPKMLTPQGQKAALVNMYVQDKFGGELSTLGKVKDMTDFRPRAPVTNVYVGGQPQAQAIPAENEEGKQIGTFSSPNYLPMNHSGLNMAGIPSVNMQTLQPEQPLKSSNKYNLVGLTSAPILNKDLYVGSKKIPKGSLSQGDYAKKHPEDVTWKDMAHVQEDYPADDEHGKAYTVDHLVDATLLPHNVTGTKAWKGETANYRSYKPTSQGQPSHGKVVSVDKINSLVGKKGYEGYTKQELIDYYKAQGFTIK